MSLKNIWKKLIVKSFSFLFKFKNDAHLKKCKVRMKQGSWGFCDQSCHDQPLTSRFGDQFLKNSMFYRDQWPVSIRWWPGLVTKSTGQGLVMTRLVTKATRPWNSNDFDSQLFSSFENEQICTNKKRKKMGKLLIHHVTLTDELR